MPKLCSVPLCLKVPLPSISPEVPSPHSRKLAKLCGADATTWYQPRKISHTTFSPHCVLSFLWGSAIPTCSPSLLPLSVLLSQIPTSLCLAAPFLSFWLSYFRTISPFSVGLIFTSSTSQKFSALSLAVGPFWVSGCLPFIQQVCSLDIQVLFLDLNQWDRRWGIGVRNFPCALGIEWCTLKGGNRWAPVSSGNWRIFVTRRCAWFCFSDEKRLKHPMDSTCLEDVRKTREEQSCYPFRYWRCKEGKNESGVFTFLWGCRRRTQKELETQMSI